MGRLKSDRAGMAARCPNSCSVASSAPVLIPRKSFWILFREVEPPWQLRKNWSDSLWASNSPRNMEHARNSDWLISNPASHWTAQKIPWSAHLRPETESDSLTATRNRRIPHRSRPANKRLPAGIGIKAESHSCSDASSLRTLGTCDYWHLAPALPPLL